jgi:hypothetical protein
MISAGKQVRNLYELCESRAFYIQAPGNCFGDTDSSKPAIKKGAKELEVASFEPQVQ